MPNTPVGTPTVLTIDAIVRDVANQLHSLSTDPPNNPVIQLTGCEIELSVKVVVEGGGGIKFYVFDASAKASEEETSKIKLTFGAVGQPLVMVANNPGVLEPVDRSKARV